MPSINRIRVNNVKYNFGTQFYDDFTMRMHGKNTLYDLANGGGKSVLMLLLLQNMIPNCTLDEKQPIEKLFRTGNGNTTIHSLVEWKLEEALQEDGYRYMTTGFCARKAKDANEAEEQKDIASVEYFNYCIFYRNFNKNDILNLPLAKDGERVTFQGLKSYLKELEHRDMSLKVCVFERKGEYQRFISRYGLHESQWEIIRGINKTEGHVRTYFENNYKTTRKVVEDLLIEEIIEKAYRVKTELEEDGSDEMAKLLMDIKEQLTILAKKKKDIASYDHQMELVNVLSDKVASFLDLFEEQSKLRKLLADICVTGEQFANADTKQMEMLEGERDEKHAQKTAQRKRMECLKIARDKKQVEVLRTQTEQITKEWMELSRRLAELTEDMNMKESMNDYLEYIKDRAQYRQTDLMIKNMLAESSFDEEAIYTYVYNLKIRMDIVLTDIRGQIDTLKNELIQEDAKRQYNEKLLQEARVSLAVATERKEIAEREIVELSEKLSALRMSMHHIQFTQIKDQKSAREQMLADTTDAMHRMEDTLFEAREKIANEQLHVSVLTAKYKENEQHLSELGGQEAQYLAAGEKLQTILEIYKAKTIGELTEGIGKRITDAIIESEKLRREIALATKRKIRLSEGRLIDKSEAALRVLHYIETRHGETAMYGMDYLSALPVEQQKEILAVNPELPYGVIVADYAKISEDPNLRNLDTGAGCVYVYDKEQIKQRSVYASDHVFLVSRKSEELTDATAIEAMLANEDAHINELEQQLAIKEEMLATYREDQTFAIQASDSEFLKAGKRLEEARTLDKQLCKQLNEAKQTVKELEIKIEKTVREIAEERKKYEECMSDVNKLITAEQLTELIAKQEAIVSENEAQMERLNIKLRQLVATKDDNARSFEEERARVKTLEQREYSIMMEWDNSYKPYYNIDREYEILSISDEELKARFTALVNAGNEEAVAVEDKRVLMDTLKVSMERTLKNIEKLGVKKETLADYEARGLLYLSDENVLASCKQGIDDVKDSMKSLENRRKKKESEQNRLEGSISYAISNVEAAYGSYEDVEASLSEIITDLENGEAVLARLTAEAKACEEACRKYSRQQGYMIDLYKDVKRIVVSNDISLSDAVPRPEEKEQLREIFEDALIRFDRSTKALERAKNELLKFKGNTAASLDQMEVYELANSIRNDVVIPDDYEAAQELLNSLNAMIEYIRLERDRIEKSLSDMETMKENFETQCLQRCLDVRTELDKLPKLSRIMLDGEAIQMVGLTVPYVKDEFLKQRMSDYIDRIVEQADDYDNDKERMKFIRNSLTLKRMFGVIVTDMNAIKLSLYKRERIKEQSRYLKYEEAVGSTGQSQGIYIQFLVSIINYISGMYQTGNEDLSTKTIFIDNPFGAAKDVYIWEPIFALLAANHVQLIVPARGATPAITGRFDVNYILGQQMTGGKQLTVVTDYTSRVDQEELEYQDLEYEQVSFDFI
ncbi:MAG: hypothetical protein PUA62_10670 [Lachnospiraceae bacterium]|nr:hypothetical protein [Lachnospiraceae bacterium]